METPSSTKRSDAMTSSGKSINLQFPSMIFDESEKTKTKLRERNSMLQNQDRSALNDLTNDSPILGLVMGNLQTPSSADSKKRTSSKQGKCGLSPGSGESLLRREVKTLLQKVEEEAELAKITLEKRPLYNLLGNFPMTLVAPTLANTPQLFNHSEGRDAFPSATPVTEKFMMQQQKQEVIESENLITRSLLLDFSDKSASSRLPLFQG